MEKEEGINILSNIIKYIDDPIIIWKIDINKNIIYQISNSAFDIYFDLNMFKNHMEKIEKKIKLKYFTCIKKKKNYHREFIIDDKLYISQLIYLKGDYIYEKILAKIDSHDLFNMVLIIKKREIIYDSNLIFRQNTYYNRKYLDKKKLSKIFKKKIEFCDNNSKKIYDNILIANNNLLINVNYYTIKLSNLYDILIIKDTSINQDNKFQEKIFKYLDVAIIIFKRNESESESESFSKKNFDNFLCYYYNKKFALLFDINRDLISMNIRSIFGNEIYAKIKDSCDNNIVNKIKYNNEICEINIMISNNNSEEILIIQFNIIDNQCKNFLLDALERIKQPATYVSNTLSLLADTSLKSDQKEYVNKSVKYNNMQMTTMMKYNDYINIKLNNYKINNEIFNIRKELENLYEKYIIDASEKNIDFILNVTCNVPPYIIVDKKKIEQIISIMVDNSLAKTCDEKIELKIHANHLENNNYQLIITINDTSIEQNNDINIDIELVKENIRILNGNIKMITNIGCQIDIPIMECTDMIHIEDNTKDLFKSKNVLIYDNDINHRIIISKILSKWNIKSFIATTYKEALFILKNNKIDLCFIEMENKKINYEILINNIKNISIYIVIIGMTNNKISEKCQNNLFNYIIPKPLNKSSVLKLFINIFSDIGLAYKKHSTNNIELKKDMKIILDSNSKNNVKNLLDKLGYTNLHLLENESLENMQKSELILFDINNKSVHNNIKKILNHKSRPYIIAITDNCKNIKLKKKYIDAHISKPIDENELKAILKVISRRVY